MQLDDEERKILEQVERQRGRADWHSVAILVGPLATSPVEHLRNLAARRLAREAPGGATTQRYAITEKGRAALHGRGAADETRLFAEAADAGPSALIELFAPLFADGAAFAAALGRVLDQFPDERQAVARGLQVAPMAERTAVARRLFDDPASLAALLEAWRPPRLHFLGEHAPLLPDGDWDELLARGLAHPSPAARSDAAALAFATDHAARLSAPIAALAAAGDRTAVLALAGADDPESLAVLLAHFAGADSGLAALAARALAERPDGAEVFARALTDPRDEVRRAASFADAVRGRGRERAPR